HARSAVGMQQLHYGMAIEIEGVFEIRVSSARIRPHNEARASRFHLLSARPARVSPSAGRGLETRTCAEFRKPGPFPSDSLPTRSWRVPWRPSLDSSVTVG